MKKVVVLCLSVLMLMVAVPVVIEAENDISGSEKISTIFPDVHLAEVVQESLGKASVDDLVTQDELDAIESIDADNAGIVDLSGMEYLNNVLVVRLANNPAIVDISPLMQLQQLWYLDLNYDEQIDLSMFADADLPLLENLYLNYIGADDFSVLASLPQLGVLQIEGNELSNLDSLADLSGLFSLWANSNQITDISRLSKHDGLTYLYLDNNKISDISVLGMLPDLTSYDVSDQIIVNTNPAVIIPGAILTVDEAVITGINNTQIDLVDASPAGYVFNRPEISWSPNALINARALTYTELETTDRGTFFVTVIQALTTDTTIPVISADAEITYMVGSAMSEAAFLNDIHAQTDDGSPITSDFGSMVNFAVVGDYQVTLNAVDESGNAAVTVSVMVHIIPGSESSNDNSMTILPQTGNPTEIVFLAAGALLIIGGGLLIIKRK